MPGKKHILASKQIFLSYKFSWPFLSLNLRSGVGVQLETGRYQGRGCIDSKRKIEETSID